MSSDALQHAKNAFQRSVQANIDSLPQRVNLVNSETPTMTIKTKEFGILLSISFLGNKHSHILASHEQGVFSIWDIRTGKLYSNFRFPRVPSSIISLSDSHVL